MKILYTATVLSHICQFHLPYMQMLQEKGNKVHVAAHNNLAVKNGLELRYCDKFIEVPFSRTPQSSDNIKAYRQLKMLLDRERYDVVLCNTPVGGVVTRLAAKKERKGGMKVIYMAHGFHFYKGAPKKNWIVFYPIEKFMAKYCDILITINQEDFNFATKNFKNVSIKRIHGVGVRTDRYHPVISVEEYFLMRQNEGLSEDDFIVLCTGELNENKDQKTLIFAAAELKKKIPNLKVLLAGNGPTEKDLRKQIKGNQLEDVVRLLGYRTDLEKITPVVDVVVSCSKREGLGLSLIEAMLCGKPVVGAVNRGHTELIKHGDNGYLVEAENVKGFADKIYSLYINSFRAKKMGLSGYKRAQQYTVDAVKEEMENIFT